MAEKMGIKFTDKQQELVRLLSNDIRYSLVFGGSRSGKTFLFAYAILTRAIKAPGSRHLCLRTDAVDAKQSLANETFPKIRALEYPDLQWRWDVQEGYFSLYNATNKEDRSQIWLGGIKDQERLDKLLGKEYATIYLNEASIISYDAFLQVSTRLSQNVQEKVGGRPPTPLKQKMYIDLNPTTSTHWTHQVFVDGFEPIDRQPITNHAANYQVYEMNPLDNADNLSPEYLEALKNLPIAQRRRFFEGKYGTDDPYALWKRDMIVVKQPGRAYDTIVVAVDPAVTTDIGANETGIVVAGTVQGHGGVQECYILEDASGVYTAAEWGNKAIELYNRFRANYVVAEVNQGGEMVKRNIEVSANNVPVLVKTVHASQGKVTRAEPISNLYSQGKVFHVRNFNSLEDQMCSFKSNFNRHREGYSPDRVDALVYAVTALLPEVNAHVHIRQPPVVPKRRSSLARR